MDCSFFCRMKCQQKVSRSPCYSMGSGYKVSQLTTCCTYLHNLNVVILTYSPPMLVLPVHYVCFEYAPMCLCCLSTMYICVEYMAICLYCPSAMYVLVTCMVVLYICYPLVEYVGKLVCHTCILPLADLL